jgi:hypothetical protein
VRGSWREGLACRSGQFDASPAAAATPPAAAPILMKSLRVQAMRTSVDEDREQRNCHETRSR